MNEDGHADITDHEHTLDVIAQEAIQIMTPLDCMINVICLYLQCPFARDDFAKYCGLYGKCWNKCLEKKTENGMKRKYRESRTICKENGCNVVKMTAIPTNSNTTTPIETENIDQEKGEMKCRDLDAMDVCNSLNRDRDISTPL